MTAEHVTLDKDSETSLLRQIDFEGSGGGENLWLNSLLEALLLDSLFSCLIFFYLDLLSPHN